MPQLSPLNWVLLFILFWVVFFFLVSMVWWNSKPMFVKMKGDEKLMPSGSSYRWRWS